MRASVLQPAVAPSGPGHAVQPRPPAALQRRTQSPQERLAHSIDTSPRLAAQARRRAAIFGPPVQQDQKAASIHHLPHASEEDQTHQLKAVIQAKRILRHGSLVEVPEDYVLQPGEEAESGLRRRRVAGQAQSPQHSPPTEDAPPQAAPTHMETIHGARAHGAVSTGSTVVSALTNLTHGTDVNALINAGTDTVTSASRARRELGRGEYRNAAISGGQAVLSGVQTATATPLSHMVGHAAAAMIGSPLPLPVGDALWYPANWAKKGLDVHRTPKVKTE